MRFTGYIGRGPEATPMIDLVRGRRREEFAAGGSGRHRKVGRYHAAIAARQEFRDFEYRVHRHHKSSPG